MNRLLLVPTLALALSAGGCTLWSSSEPLDEASYQTGYGQGCNTGQQRQNAYSDYVDRDETRYGEDRSYKAGWNAGLRACRRSAHDPYGANPGAPSSGPHP